MSDTHTALTTIEPRHIDAANALHTEDPATVAVLAAQIRRAVATVTDLDRDDLAQVAALLAPLLVTEDHSTSQAAAVAVRRAAAAMRRDRDGDLTPLDDVMGENGEPLVRLASPWTPDPAAPYTTTTADRIVSAASTLDHRTATVAAACHSYEWKGGKPPAAAIRRALGLPPVTGRAGTAWTATLKDEAPAAVAALHDAYRDALTLDWQGCEPTTTTRPAHRAAPTVARHRSTQAPRLRRIVDERAAATDAAAKERSPEDARITRDKAAVSGPATAVVTVSRRSLDRLGVLDGSARRRATEDDARHGSAVAATLPATLPAWTPERTKRPTAQQVQDGEADAVTDESSDFDAMATGTDQRTSSRLPGVSVHRCTKACPADCHEDGAAVAVAGTGAGTGAGSGAPVSKAPASRKGKGGSTGPTVPVGKAGSAARVASTVTGKPSAAGMGSKGECACDQPRAVFCHLHAVALKDNGSRSALLPA